MKYLSVPDKVQQKVLDFYDNLWNYTKTESSDPDSFIDDLSPPIRGEMKLSLYRNMLMKIPYFTRMDKLVVTALVELLKSQVYMKEDFIMRAGEPGDYMAFVERGTAAILDPATQGWAIGERRVLRILELGDYFGEISLFFGTKRTADVVAMDWTCLELLYTKDWRQMQKQFPEELVELEEKIKNEAGSYINKK